jgi:hypothetical protein
MVAATLIPGILLDRKIRAEPDWNKKLQIGVIMRMFAAFGPWNVGLLLVTGIGNIYNRFVGAPYAWYDETWLVVKICLFAIIASNALFIAPKLGMKRAMVIKSIVEKNGPLNDETLYAGVNRKIAILFGAQTLLLLTILYLSVFGPGKHPGVL